MSYNRVYHATGKFSHDVTLMLSGKSVTSLLLRVWLASASLISTRRWPLMVEMMLLIFISFFSYFCWVCSFMCHHSLPSIVTPIRNKRNLTRMFFYDYLLIASSYLLLCFSAVAAFADVRHRSSFSLECFGFIVFRFILSWRCIDSCFSAWHVFLWR